VRGFTLNYDAKHLINFDVISNMILNLEDVETVTVRTERKIKCKRNGNGGEGCIQIVTEPEDKNHRVFHKAAQTR
jgi:hypothetical protein